MLYKTTHRCIAAMRMDRKSGGKFLDMTSEEELDEFLNLLKALTVSLKMAAENRH